jgi:hypothetical protein
MHRITHLRRALAGLSVALALTLPAAAQAAPFHMLFERNTSAGAGSELFHASFTTLADLMNANAASSGFTQIDVNDNFDVAGFSIDAGGYHLLFERNTPAGAGSELFLATFATLADLLNANAGSSGFTQIDVNDNFDVAGFAAVRDGTGGGVVPEPSTLLLVALGLAGSAARRIWAR